MGHGNRVNTHVFSAVYAIAGRNKDVDIETHMPIFFDKLGRFRFRVCLFLFFFFSFSFLFSVLLYENQTPLFPPLANAYSV